MNNTEKPTAKIVWDKMKSKHIVAAIRKVIRRKKQ